jgi:hypothetical protein
LDCQKPQKEESNTPTTTTMVIGMLCTTALGLVLWSTGTTASGYVEEPPKGYYPPPPYGYAAAPSKPYYPPSDPNYYNDPAYPKAETTTTDYNKNVTLLTCASDYTCGKDQYCAAGVCRVHGTCAIDDDCYNLANDLGSGVRGLAYRRCLTGGKCGVSECVPVSNCPTSPCAILSSSCGEKYVQCVDDYCDGCGAKFFNAQGERVCENIGKLPPADPYYPPVDPYYPTDKKPYYPTDKTPYYPDDKAAYNGPYDLYYPPPAQYKSDQYYGSSSSSYGDYRPAPYPYAGGSPYHGRRTSFYYGGAAAPPPGYYPPPSYGGGAYDPYGSAASSSSYEKEPSYPVKTESAPADKNVTKSCTADYACGYGQYCAAGVCRAHGTCAIDDDCYNLANYLGSGVRGLAYRRCITGGKCGVSECVPVSNCPASPCEMLSHACGEKYVQCVETFCDGYCGAKFFNVIGELVCDLKADDAVITKYDALYPADKKPYYPTTPAYYYGPHYPSDPYKSDPFYPSDPYKSETYKADPYYPSDPYKSETYKADPYYPSDPYKSETYKADPYYSSDPYKSDPYQTSYGKTYDSSYGQPSSYGEPVEYKSPDYGSDYKTPYPYGGSPYHGRRTTAYGAPPVYQSSPEYYGPYPKEYYHPQPYYPSEPYPSHPSGYGKPSGYYPGYGKPTGYGTPVEYYPGYGGTNPYDPKDPSYGNDPSKYGYVPPASGHYTDSPPKMDYKEVTTTSTTKSCSSEADCDSHDEYCAVGVCLALGTCRVDADCYNKFNLYGYGSASGGERGEMSQKCDKGVCQASPCTVLAQCSSRPCDYASCDGDYDYCVDDYCGACGAKFYNAKGSKICDYEHRV